MIYAAHSAAPALRPSPDTTYHVQPYVLIPDRLIEAHARDPLAVGVYVAVARLARIHKGAVPLSAADLAAWMGCPDEANQVAIMRRIARLEQAGWLRVTRRSGHKHTLLPTWGPDREGSVRPWDFDQPSSGRPEHLRGRRVPQALLDTYLGQLKPQDGRAPALISRYLTQPLLDLTDIGVYTIQLRTEIQPTARLTHLGLVRGALPSPRSLLMEAASGTLTTLRGGETIGVGLTPWGYDQLGIAPPAPPESVTGSLRGSTWATLESRDPAGDLPLSDAENPAFTTANARNAWDVRDHEVINMISPPKVLDLAGGGQHTLDIDDEEPQPSPEIQPIDKQVSPIRLQIPPGACDENHVAPEALSPEIVASHQALNPERVIFPGEWWELLQIEQAHGAEQLLIWQARAARVCQTRARQISPAYYEACAAQSAFESYRPPRRERAPLAVVEPPIITGLSAPAPATSALVPTLDPACDALLCEMGIRERERLVGVPLVLIQQWAQIVDHAGLAARFDDPRGFAHTQLQKGQSPPSRAELDRWAERARKRAAAASPPALTDEQVQQIRARAAVTLARAAALAPDDLTDDERLHFLADLEQGMTDAEVLARLSERRAAASAPPPTPEQICTQLAERLRQPMYHKLWSLLDRLKLVVEGDVLRVVCMQAGDLGVVEREVARRIRGLLEQYDWQPTVRVVAQAAPPMPTDAPAAPPDWIAPECWAALPGLMRTALLGSTLEDGELRCASPTLTTLVRTRFARELDTLLREVSDGA